MTTASKPRRNRRRACSSSGYCSHIGASGHGLVASTCKNCKNGIHNCGHAAGCHVKCKSL
jgi:hypothetical protein